MAGETDINTLLSGLTPQLLNDTYVFCTLPDGVYGDYAMTRPIASFQEVEGLTLVMTQGNADAQSLVYDGLFCCISLQIHSSLQAVGLTAAISSKLADADISANIIAGYYHDHLFVPQAKVVEALEVLNNINNR